MKEYAKKLKTQSILIIIAILALIAVQVLSFTGVIEPVYPNVRFADFWQGFIAGASGGITALLIIGLVINIRAICNEERLKKLYIKENDERTAAVCTKGKSAGASVGIGFIFVAGMISGYFNITIFATAIACAVILSLFTAGGQFYYSQKM